MTIDQFKESLRGEEPPAGITPYLAALWQDQRGNWDSAHGIVQDLNDANAAWVHAYLHRKEGDESNARYWYDNARKSFPASQTLDEEWEDLAGNFLAKIK